MLIKAMVLMGIANIVVSFTISSVQLQSAPYYEIRDINRDIARRSMMTQLNGGFDKLAGLEINKRSDSEQAGEKRAALSTFDSLGGMGLGKRSSPGFFLFKKRAVQHLSSLDTLGGMGFGRK